MDEAFPNPHPLIGKVGGMLILRKISSKFAPHPGTLLRLEQDRKLVLRAIVRDESDGKVLRFNHFAITWQPSSSVLAVWGTPDRRGRPMLWDHTLVWRPFFSEKKS